MVPFSSISLSFNTILRILGSTFTTVASGTALLMSLWFAAESALLGSCALSFFCFESSSSSMLGGLHTSSSGSSLTGTFFNFKKSTYASSFLVKKTNDLPVLPALADLQVMIRSINVTMI